MGVDFFCFLGGKGWLISFHFFSGTWILKALKRGKSLDVALAHGVSI